MCKYAKSSSIILFEMLQKHFVAFSVFLPFVCWMNERTNEKNRFEISVYIKQNHLCGLINFMEPCDVIIIENEILCDWHEFHSQAHLSIKHFTFMGFRFCLLLLLDFYRQIWIALIQFEISCENLHFIAFSVDIFISLRI